MGVLFYSSQTLRSSITQNDPQIDEKVLYAAFNAFQVTWMPDRAR
jgi:hypothetical protein